MTAGEIYYRDKHMKIRLYNYLELLLKISSLQTCRTRRVVQNCTEV